jgi:predicted RNA binding protein YcfA (HicA-like mRNA interferase family)
MCVERKNIVRVLMRNDFKKLPRYGVGTSHTKYQRTNADGTTTTYSLQSKKTLGRSSVQDISRVTGIPVEEFYRSGGSKKHQNGIGTFGLINNTTMIRG